MSLFKRARKLFSANVNALFDEWEDPAKMVDQYMRDLTKELHEVKQATAGVIAEETRANKALREKQDDVDKHTEIAKKALQSGNEEHARTLLARRAELESELVALQEQAQVATKNAVEMRTIHDKLVKDIQILNQRRTTIKANASIAKATETVHGFGKNSKSGEGALAAFDRLEQKTATRRDQAAALASLNETPRDEVDDLMDLYSSGGCTSIDNELDLLKEELGL